MQHLERRHSVPLTLAPPYGMLTHTFPTQEAHMLDEDTIEQQQALLTIHRRTLAHLMEQAAQYGGEVFAPPPTANGITQAREEIRRIKAALRAGGVVVEDEPNDLLPAAGASTSQ